jgi:hypothetical protein
MKRIKFGFRNLSAEETLAVCERSVKSLASLSAEQLENVPHAELSATVNAARESASRIAVLRAELKAEISRRNELLRTARQQTMQCVGLAAIKLRADPAGPQRLGFDSHAPWSRVSPPEMPQNLRAEPTPSAGEAKLRWRLPGRDRWFEIEMQTGEFAPDKWQPAQMTCFQRSCTVPGLVSGGLYWFRVRARNRRGAGPWSNLATVRVR